MITCLICLRETTDSAGYHRACLRSLFGTLRLPAAIDLDLATLHTVGLTMVGRTTLSGVQRKLSANLSAEKRTLHVAVGPGQFILKPEAGTYPELPANELVTMRIAALMGVDIPPCGLVPLADNSLAYVVRRFDRLADGRKVAQEDFCQLAGLRPKQKYDGSAEGCVKLVRQFTSEPAIETLKLFRRLLCCWWTGNGDAHLKNFSVTTSADGIVQLSPAYDQLCTRIVVPSDQLALPVGGKRDGLRREHWVAFGNYCGLPGEIDRARTAAPNLGDGRRTGDDRTLPA